MSEITNNDHSQRRGKLNKKDDVIYCIRNGKEHAYAIRNPNREPPSKAQKSNRANFGKINAQVNVIMADPEQVQKWEMKREAFNRNAKAQKGITAKQYTTTRQFVFAAIGEQLALQQARMGKRKTPKPIVFARGVKLHIKPFAMLSTAELYEILKARFAVFVMEQKCFYLDMDNVDYQAIHLALWKRGKVVAYARLFPGEEPTNWHIGRLLTVERNKGYGKFLMQQALEEAAKQGAENILIDAQTYALDFYKKLGFRPFGDKFIEAGIEHIKMELNIMK